MKRYFQKLGSLEKSPLKNFIFKKLSSERDISPEKETNDFSIKENGQNATSRIQGYLNLARLEIDLVSKNLLSDLNKIFAPEVTFSNLFCQKLSTGHWEIFLEEEKKGRIQLSESGSGLKTIILVLIYLILVPDIKNQKLSKFIFAFEELENNLHPALLRNLLLYLKDKAVKENCIFFLTTHSNVVIDLFSKDQNSQILHVINEKHVSNVVTVKSYDDSIRILDDLDVRASDLLQSNLVIWVEGPSDRIYLKKWIDLLSNKELIEGAHYQIVFYGGRLLSHLSFDDPSEEELDEFIKLLTVNRNSAILIDSDKKARQTQLNETKKRAIKELESKGGFIWVTKGREIENYVPISVINSALETDFKDEVSQYEKIDAFLENNEKGLGKRFLNSKMKYAHLFSEHFEIDDLENHLDLKDRVKGLIKFIRSVN